MRRFLEDKTDTRRARLRHRLQTESRRYQPPWYIPTGLIRRTLPLPVCHEHIAVRVDNHTLRVSQRGRGARAAVALNPAELPPARMRVDPTNLFQRPCSDIGNE